MILRKLSALVRMIRPELPLAAGVCVVLGQAIGLGKLPPAGLVLLGFALGVCLSASQMVFNDYFDLEVDRVNAPQRSLPSGQVSMREAALFGLLLAAAALVIAAVLHPIALVLSLVTWVLGFLYNWKLKSAGLWGNLIVAYSVGMTIFIGGISVGQARNPMVGVFALICFVFDLAEEIAGDAMDMEGDRERESKSLAIVYGRKNALRISGSLFGVVVVLSLAPILLGETGLAFLLPIAAMDLLIVIFTVRLLRSQTPGEGRGAMRVMYMGASLGLLAFLLGRFLA